MSAIAAGKVFLVGAGPGNPGLISLRAVECLRSADLVLYDGLVNPQLLRFTSGECRRTARIRRDGHAIVPQTEINQLLITEALAGRQVVRLKGGDPCTFGRGSEEAAALQEAGVAFEIVPGITSAAAAVEYAGFSLTHRGISSAVAMITGHEEVHAGSSGIDFQRLAGFPGTLVFYMGFSRLAEICRQLIECGLASDTPAAIVCHATLPGQQVVVATLQDLPGKAAEHKLRPPSLIVVGQCVSLRKQPSWFEQLPLFGVSIGITRPIDQSIELADQIARMGGEPVCMPMIRVEPVDSEAAAQLRRQLKGLGDYDWLIFTSRNGVEHFVRHLWDAGRDLRALGSASIAAIGESTAETLAGYNLRADLVPSVFRAEALAEAMVPHVSGKRCLWLRASRGRDVLPAMLTRAGARIDEWIVYQNPDQAEPDEEVTERLTAGSLHWVGISSPASARKFAGLLRHLQIDGGNMATRIASISPLTSSALRETGLRVDAEAHESTWQGILKAIIRRHSAAAAGRPSKLLPDGG